MLSEHCSDIKDIKDDPAIIKQALLIFAAIHVNAPNISAILKILKSLKGFLKDFQHQGYTIEIGLMERIGLAFSVKDWVTELI